MGRKSAQKKKGFLIDPIDECPSSEPNPEGSYDEASKAFIICQLGFRYFQEANRNTESFEHKLMKNAIDAFTKAGTSFINLFGQNDAKVGVVNFYLGCSYIYLSQDKSEENTYISEAEICFKKSLEIAKSLKQDKVWIQEWSHTIKELIASSHEKLGHVYLKLHKNKEAKEHAQKALMIIKSIKGENSDSFADALVVLGTVCVGQKDFIKCEKYYKRALNIRKSIIVKKEEQKIKDSKIEQTCRGIGMVCLLQGKDEEAQKYLNQCTQWPEKKDKTIKELNSLLDRCKDIVK